MTKLEEAEKRVNKALQDGANILDLSKLGLDALPGNFPEIAPSLVELNLSGNNFQVLPVEAKACLNLTHLVLDNNQLQSGKRLHVLQKLQHLSINANELVHFPTELLELSQLEVLELDHNPISSLPSGIRLLRKLRILSVIDCRIETLPPEIASSEKLHRIHLGENPLKTPPYEIASRGIEAIRTYFDDLTKNAQSMGATNHLLAIAIDNYPPHPVLLAPRPDAVEEGRELIDVLREKYGYQAIKTLCNQDATHQAIFEALQSLVQATGPEDSVIVYFNGWTGVGKPESDLISYDHAYIPLPEILSQFASMRARHVLLIVDNQFQSRQFGVGKTRNIDGDRETLPSRSVLFREDAEWTTRFTPSLTLFLQDTTVPEFTPEELPSRRLRVETFAGYGDEGGQFVFRQKKQPEQGAPLAPEISGASSDTEIILQKLGEIERLRLSLSGIVAATEARETRKKIEELNAEVEALRAKAGFENAKKDPNQEWMETIDWNGANFTNTLEGYQNYLTRYPQGLFQNEARRRISDLQVLEQEAAIFADIQANRSFAVIQDYLTTFPAGQHRAEVEKIRAELEADDATFWQKTEHENTLEAYLAYRQQSKTKQKDSLAASRIHELESTQGHLVREAKLIFVGNGRVGKTSLSKVLCGEPFDPAESSTHGIRIQPWPAKAADGQEITLNIWDFGGQEIYHNTHSFFLTKRALYCYVWSKATQDDAREHPERDEREKNFFHEYWLDTIKIRSEGSPVLMVQNRFGQEPPAPLDQVKFKDPYHIQDFLHLNAQLCSPEEIGDFRRKLLEQYRAAPGLKELIPFRLPDNWVAARAELQKLAPKKPYIKYDKFCEICAKHDITDEVQFGRYLNDIGTLLFFPDQEGSLLHEIVILDPRWATSIVYRILNQQVQDNGGRFEKKDLTAQWKNMEVPDEFAQEFRFRSDQEVTIFLELMRSFEICFALPGEPGVFIAPQFLPAEKPDFPWNSESCRRFGYQYEFLPRHVIARAIARLGEYAVPGQWWREGIVIKHKNTEAKIETDYTWKVLRVEIFGEKPEALQEWLDDQFADLHQKMLVKSVVFCANLQCNAPISREEAENRRKNGKAEIFCTNCREDSALAKVFRTGLGGSPLPKDGMARFFIAHAPDDEDEQMKIECVKWLENSRWKNRIRIWDESQITLGANRDQAIRENFASSDVLVLLLSNNFLDSPYLQMALERQQEASAILIPIIINYCTLDGTGLENLQCLPTDGTPVLDADKQAKVWNGISVSISAMLAEKFGWV